jgi:hypothetical protein
MVQEGADLTEQVPLLGQQLLAHALAASLAGEVAYLSG